MPMINSVSVNFANMEQIMNQTDVKVSFYLKKSEADADGMCPVMARLNIGKYSEAAFSRNSVCRRQYGVRGVLQAKV